MSSWKTLPTASLRKQTAVLSASVQKGPHNQEVIVVSLRNGPRNQEVIVASLRNGPRNKEVIVTSGQ